jgi:hypothetical protein
MTLARAALFASLANFLVILPATAQNPTDPAAETASPAPETSTADETDLTPAERAEKQARAACKAKICGILASKDAQGGDVSCEVVKTWREQDIAKMLGGKFDWPWGAAVCQSKLDIARAQLVNAMTEPTHDVVLTPHKVQCSLAQKSKGNPYSVDVTIAPKVTFENGKAVAARINWGEADAPMLAYALIYAGTGLDNSTNLLGPEVVRMVNEFIGKKCKAVESGQPDGRAD